MRESAYGQSRADEDVLRVARIDSDLVDAAPQERVTRVHTRVGRVADTGVGKLRPSVAAIRGFVDTDPSLATGGAAIPLTRAEIKRVPAGVVRIGDERANRVLRQIGSQKRPGR